MKYACLLPACLVFLLLACTPALTERPAGGGEGSAAGPLAPAKPVLPVSEGRYEALKVAVGPPEATLAVWVMEPVKGTPVRGTVIFLHGFMANHYQLMNAGEAVRKAGYRAVLVDMRGFGQSTGEHITFGVLDAHDLKQLTDELEKRGMAAPALGVYGTSMGAASAILYAAEDPRVKTVIAVAPFATIRDEVPSFGRHVLRGASAFFTDSQVNAIADAVAGMADLDLDAAKPLDAIQKTKAPVLLIHGEADTIIPVEASEKLHAAAPDRTELLKIPRRGHLDLCFDVRGELQAATREWLEKHLNAER